MSVLHGHGDDALQPVPRRFAKASLRDYPPCEPVGLAASWLAHFGAGMENLPGLYINGPVGVGKSHLAAALANEIPRAVWCPMHRFFHIVRSSYAHSDATHNAPAAVAWLLSEAPTVVLDDIGRPPLRTQWERDMTETLVATLYDARTMVIATGNLSIQDMIEQSSLPERSLTCLREMLAPLRLDGPSRRTVPKPNLMIR